MSRHDPAISASPIRFAASPCDIVIRRINSGRLRGGWVFDPRIVAVNPCVIEAQFSLAHTRCSSLVVRCGLR